MKKCNECKNNFIPTKNTKGLFCSLLCYWDSLKIINYCSNCNNEVNRKPKTKTNNVFCNKSCAAIFNNSLYQKRKAIKEYLNCIECGKKLKYSQFKCCSRECNAFNKCKISFDKWIKGEISGGDKYGQLLASIRLQLIKKAEYKCTKCGWNSPNIITGLPILCVDHIDGNWKNNRPDNLQVICYNCHTLTENFGSLNKNGLSYERLLQQRNCLEKLNMACSSNG